MAQVQSHYNMIDNELVRRILDASEVKLVEIRIRETSFVALRLRTMNHDHIFRGRLELRFLVAIKTILISNGNLTLEDLFPIIQSAFCYSH